MGDSASIFDPKHARVLVVGSMGAGKTTLVHALCHDGAVLQRPKTTVGCNVDIKRLAGFNPREDRFIEFWDIGGHPDAAQARQMFFEGDVSIAGVMLVCDSSNPRSVRQLRDWVSELESAGIVLDLDRRQNDSSVVSNARKAHRVLDQDLEGGGGIRGSRSFVPVLVVRNKSDIGEVHKNGSRERLLSPELDSASVVTVSARNVQGSLFTRFFEDVFKHHTGGNLTQEDDDRILAENDNRVDAYNALSTGSRDVSWPARSSSGEGIRPLAPVSMFGYHDQREGFAGRRANRSYPSDSGGTTRLGHDDHTVDEGGGPHWAHGDTRKSSTRSVAEGSMRGLYGRAWAEGQAREKQS